MSDVCVSGCMVNERFTWWRCQIIVEALVHGLTQLVVFLRDLNIRAVGVPNRNREKLRWYLRFEISEGVYEDMV